MYILGIGRSIWTWKILARLHLLHAKANDQLTVMLLGFVMYKKDVNGLWSWSSDGASLVQCVIYLDDTIINGGNLHVYGTHYLSDIKFGGFD